MIIQKIEIKNFRSYYRDNSFELINGFNLIIGSNGDGKTTFYEALEWLFRTDGTNKMDLKYISKKRSDELLAGGADDVRVSMTYEHKGKKKRLEKMFHFEKTSDRNIRTTNYTFTLSQDNGIERTVVDGDSFNKDLPFEMYKFVMFKGEENLNVMENSNSLKQLVDNFGEVKDFDAYFNFMKYATENADRARQRAQSSDRKNEAKIRQLNRIIEDETGILSDIDREIKNKEKESANFEGLLKNIEQSKEASKLLASVNKRIDNLSKNRSETAGRIKENYTISLLDDMWILLGFAPIAEEYAAKISHFGKNRRKLEKDYYVNVGVDKAIKKVQKTDFVPLPVHIPGQKFMQEMLDDEVCKICGRPAPKHSDAWNFMLHRLEEFKESLDVNENDDIEPLYQNNYIDELQKRDTTLNDNLVKISRLYQQIKDVIEFNNRLHSDVRRIDLNLDDEFEKKKRILAQTDGLSEEQLMNNFENISNWIDQKSNADNRIKTLNSKREQHSENLENAREELSKLSEGTPAAIYARTALILQHISDAFKTAKETNKAKLLCTIENEANCFLERLNTNDFKGVIRIIEKSNGQCETFLENNDEARIFNPNTALKTTYLMSILFAISKLSSEKDKTELPMLFDAPTSSFTEAKENEFLGVISSLNKQVIIVTKSFLKENGKGEVILDNDRIKNVNGRVYRIEKKKPFDDKNLGTIQTIISKIK